MWQAAAVSDIRCNSFRKRKHRKITVKRESMGAESVEQKIKGLVRLQDDKRGQQFPQWHVIFMTFALQHNKSANLLCGFLPQRSTTKN